MTQKYEKLVYIFLVVVLGFSFRIIAAESKSSEKELGAVVARDWIAVGIRQIDKGYYEQAEQSFVSALDYQQYLSQAEQKKLSDLLEQAHAAAVQNKSSTEILKNADTLVQNGQLLEAKQKLETAVNNPSLDKNKQQFLSKLKDIDSRIDEQKKQIDELYRQALKSFENNDILNARDYLAKIDQIFAEYIFEQNQVEQPQIQVEKNKSDMVLNVTVGQENSPEQLLKEKTSDSDQTFQSYQEDNEISKQQKVMISYISAVISDSITKARTCSKNAQYEDAKSVLNSAIKILDENKSNLPVEFYDQNKSMLNEIEQGLVGSN